MFNNLLLVDYISLDGLLTTLSIQGEFNYSIKTTSITQPRPSTNSFIFGLHSFLKIAKHDIESHEVNLPLEKDSNSFSFSIEHSLPNTGGIIYNLCLPSSWLLDMQSIKQFQNNGYGFKDYWIKKTNNQIIELEIGATDNPFIFQGRAFNNDSNHNNIVDIDQDGFFVLNTEKERNILKYVSENYQRIRYRDIARLFENGLPPKNSSSFNRFDKDDTIFNYQIKHPHIERVRNKCVIPENEKTLFDDNEINDIKESLKVVLSTPKEDDEEKSDKELSIPNRFRFEQAQAFFDDKDLDIGTGASLEVLKKLHEKFGKVVLFQEFDEYSNKKEASEKIRTAVSRIKTILNLSNIPIEIKNRKGKGYAMHPKS